MSSGLFKNVIDKMCLEIIYLIYTNKKDSALDNLLWLICHKTKPNQKSVFLAYIFILLKFFIYSTFLYKVKLETERSEHFSQDIPLTVFVKQNFKQKAQKIYL